MKALRPWTTWSRSRSAASPSRRLQRPARGKNIRINIIDTPGHVDFTAEVERSLRVLDGAVAVFDSVSGVQPQTETVWRQGDKYKVPRICFVNKMDKNGADFEHVISTPFASGWARGRWRSRFPIGAEANFKGVIDLIEMKAILWHDETMGAKYPIEAIPADLQKKAEAFRLQLIEVIAETDECCCEKFLEGETPTIEELKKGIRQATIDLKVFPVHLRFGIQEQGRADAARCGGRLSAQPAGQASGGGHRSLASRIDEADPQGGRQRAAFGAGLQDDQRSVSASCLHPHLLGFAEDGRHGAESAYRQDGARGPPGEDARQQARGHHGDLRRRYLRLRGPEGSEDGRHAICIRIMPIALERHHFPGAGDSGCG